MTTYTDFSETTEYTEYSEYSEYSDPAESASCCCCGSVDVEPTYEDAVFEPDPMVDPTDTDASASAWVDPEPQVVTAETYADPAPADPSAVIPAGQPGGPEIDSSASLYPTEVTVGPPTVPLISNDTAGLYPSVATIGGHDLGGITIEAPDGTATPSSSFGPTVFTVGPSDPNSTVNVLASLYGMAAETDDIMSQIAIAKTISSMQAQTMIWTL